MLILASRPYDVTKLLFRTILATERRPVVSTFKDNSYNIVFEETGETLPIEFDPLNYEFIQKMFTEENGIFEIDEYGKVFYEIGRVSLVVLLMNMINVKKHISEYTNVNYPKFITEYEDEFYKIHQSISGLWKQFVNKVSLTDLYESNVTFSPDSVFGIIDFYEKKRTQYNFEDMTNGDLLSAIYGSLLFLITGLLAIICGSMNIHTDEIFVSEFNMNKAIEFIKNAAKSDVLDSESKVRFFSLCLCFFNLNRFFRINSGISNDDPMVNVLANLGYAVSQSLKSDEDFKFIDEELITGLFGSKASFIGFTGNYDALKNFITYKENFAIKNDFSVPWVLGSSFIGNLVAPKDSQLENFYTPIITKYIESSVNLSSYAIADDLSIDRSFNFLRDCVTGADIDYVTSVDPFTFYQITLIASTYRAIKNKSEVYSKLSDDRKKKVTFGVWLADSLLFTLYNQWFNSGKFYNQAKRPKYTEDLIQSTLEILKKEVNVVLYTYLEYLTYPITTDDEKEFINKFGILYNRNIAYLLPKNITGAFGYNPSEFSNKIKNNLSSIVFAQIASIDNKNFAFDYIISQLAATVNLEKSETLKLIAKANPSETFFQDDLLDKILDTSITIENNSTLSDDEFLFVTYLPILDSIEHMLNTQNIGQYFDFVSPDQLKTGNNFEYILNEEVRAPISRISTIENAF